MPTRTKRKDAGKQLVVETANAFVSIADTEVLFGDSDDGGGRGKMPIRLQASLIDGRPILRLMASFHPKPERKPSRRYIDINIEDCDGVECTTGLLWDDEGALNEDLVHLLDDHPENSFKERAYIDRHGTFIEHRQFRFLSFRFFDVPTDLKWLGAGMYRVGHSGKNFIETFKSSEGNIDCLMIWDTKQKPFNLKEYVVKCAQISKAKFAAWEAQQREKLRQRSPEGDVKPLRLDEHGNIVLADETEDTINIIE